MQPQNICDLPDDILIHMFSKICLSHNFKTDIWKKELQLLAVCKKWRNLALLRVYRHVRFSLGSSPAYGQQSVSSNTVTVDDLDMCLKTNCALVSDAGVEKSIKYIDILVNYITHPFVKLNKIVAALQKVTPQWSGVRYLTITFIDTQVSDRHINNMALHVENITQFVQAFVELMPNLENIEYRGSSDNKAVQLLCGSLLAAFFQNIKQFISSQTLLLFEALEFKNITHLDINLQNKDVTHKAVFSSNTLLYLNMRNVPLGFNWAMFTYKNKPPMIEFTNLTALKIRYNWPQFEDRSLNTTNARRVEHPKLNFPKLKILNIINHDDYQPIIYQGLFPNRLHILRLTCRTNALRWLKHANLPQINNLSLMVTASHGDGHENEFAAIDQIASKATNINYVDFYVFNHEVLYQINSTDYSSITTLNAYPSVDADAIISLIKHLPMLSSLSLFNVLVTKEQAHSYTFAFSMYEPENLVPLNKNLKKLVLVCHDHVFTSADFTIFVGHLLPRLPSLVDLQVRKQFSGTVIKFLDEQISRYPQIKKVKVSSI
ncbi:hypothetical protein COEREDRAFT_88119 [Coemansia reversa NRRL 1564]|uniref:F-box domain-containing protein n=1 Tax=Coemansia reversa (strain ATCC 12441 / NRRL 1564) TaxID=763665 RepID=A0A2G5B8C3_COERN|nr:hypothetical protein COEREDRAFT_88119 [Coemansia reversa NRRL 1564]|eukprot:PIA15276.1 hypothetical protein COEREDRAFT_88119 [Coemansia reversa NRRL 1564]